MLKVNVADVKANLSRLLEKVEAGETVVICRRNLPVAELRAIPAAEQRPRPVGLFRGRFEVGAAFFEPLPPEMLGGFEGRDR